MSKKRTSQAKEDAKLVQQMQTPVTEEDSAQKKHLRIKTFVYKNEAQAALATLIDNKDITICAGPAGTGKAQPLSCKVLTPTGWDTIGNIKEGDQVITPNGQIANVIELHDYVDPMDVYNVTFKDGRSTQCSSGHLWHTLMPDYWTTPRTLTTLDLIEKLSKTSRVYVPLLEPATTPDIEVPLDPYVLGTLLGDGGLSGGQVLLTSADEEIVAEVSKRVQPYDCQVKKISSKYGYSIIKSGSRSHSINPIKQILAELGLMGKTSKFKSIPNVYFNGSTNQRLELLQGLMDTDGTSEVNGSLYFYSISEELTNGVVALIRSLGGQARVTRKKAGYKNKEGIYKRCNDCFIVHIRYRNPKDLFKLQRKADRVSNDNQYVTTGLRILSIEKLPTPEICRCISIDSKEQLYVTDDYVVTHNSMVSIYKALDLMKRFPDKYEQIVITKPNIESGPSLGFLKGTLEDKMAEYIYSMKYIFNILLDSAKTTRMFTSEQIRVMPMGFVRGVTLSNCVFILDEAQNTTPTEMKSILSRIGPDCKMIINGDENQVDTKLVREKTGLHAAMTKLRDIPQIGIFEFANTDIVRHPLISIILDRMEGK